MYADYQNVPRPLATVLSSKMATLADLGTILGTEDLYDLLEVINVDAHNRALAAKQAE